MSSWFLSLDPNYELSDDEEVGGIIGFSQTPIITPSRQLSPAPMSKASSHFSITTLRQSLRSRTNILDDFIPLHEEVMTPRSSTTREPRATNIFNDTSIPSYISNTSNNIFGHFNKNNIVIPSPFNEMTIYQLCSWLCANPNILQLANNIHLSMQVPVADGGQFTTSVSSNLSIMPQNQDNKVSRKFFYCWTFYKLLTKVCHR